MPAHVAQAVNCHLCNGQAPLLARAEVLRRHQAHFHYCEGCDHIFAADPTWLGEAYSEAISSEDTGIATRNVLTALRLAALYHTGLGDGAQHTYVDVAGGYGLLTRLMRDLGFNYFWADAYASNLFARGFEYQPSLGACRAVSAIEVLEHTPDPLQFVRQTLTEYQADTFVFSTETFPDGRPPQPHQWGYYSLETGQHIAFFSPRGLTRLAHRLGMHHVPLGRLHVFSRRPLSPWRLRLASDKFLVTPLALYAFSRRGSRRGADQALARKARLDAHHA